MFSLFITLCIVTSLPGILSAFKDDKSSGPQDLHIGAKQLSQYLMCAKVLSIDDILVYQDETGKTFTVMHHNNRLVKTPGYETLLTHVDAVKWSKVHDYLYLDISREGISYHFLVADLYEKRGNSIENEE